MGHNEEPTPYVASAGFERAEQACFDRKAQLLKLPEDGVGAQGHMPFDVFEEAPFRIELADDAADVRPEVPRIVFSKPPSCEAEGLAGIAASKDMNLSTPRAAVEGGDIAPDRSLIQGRVCHPRHENGRREGFPLDVTNSSISGFGNVQSKFETSDAGAEGDTIETMGGM